MTSAHVTAYGSWQSLITADLITASTIDLSMPLIDHHDFYWLEGRPTEGGRNALVKRTADGTSTEVLPQPWNVRTRVHEYGGGEYTVKDGTVYFTNGADQRLYRVFPAGTPEPLTPDEQTRYADLTVDSRHQQLICIGEKHASGNEPVNMVVSIALDGTHATRILATGADFYATPRLSPDGHSLA